jgi:hypothetical protein
MGFWGIGTQHYGFLVKGCGLLEIALARGDDCQVEIGARFTGLELLKTPEVLGGSANVAGAVESDAQAIVGGSKIGAQFQGAFEQLDGLRQLVVVCVGCRQIVENVRIIGR